MTYITIQAGDLKELDVLVNQNIERGWKPLGGVGTYLLHQEANYAKWIEVWFIQAMTLEEV